MNTIINLIKTHPYTATISTGLLLMWSGAALWCGVAPMLIATGLLIVTIALVHACETH